MAEWAHPVSILHLSPITQVDSACDRQMPVTPSSHTLHHLTFGPVLLMSCQEPVRIFEKGPRLCCGACANAELIEHSIIRTDMSD